MSDLFSKYLADHQSLTRLVAERIGPQVDRLGRAMIEALGAGKKILIFGNGGSAADAQHFAAEMVGRYRRPRRPLPAVALTTDSSALTCIGNDFSFEDIFARQVQALAVKGDVVLGLSTSGNSQNVLRALQAARQNQAVTAALLGHSGGVIAAEADHPIIIPSQTTGHIQEMHIIVIHLLCEMVDEWAGGSSGK